MFMWCVGRGVEGEWTGMGGLLSQSRIIVLRTLKKRLQMVRGRKLQRKKAQIRIRPLFCAISVFSKKMQHYFCAQQQTKLSKTALPLLPLPLQRDFSQVCTLGDLLLTLSISHLEISENVAQTPMNMNEQVFVLK